MKEKKKSGLSVPHLGKCALPAEKLAQILLLQLGAGEGTKKTK
jgi:hypothetical protein